MDNGDTESIRVAKPEKTTLLERYNIPVEHLSYEYISKCTNGKILERIVLILRSGEEGVYPDLTRHAEERLAALKPTSVILRKAEPVRTRNMLEPSERKEIDNDINNWLSEMQYREKDLEEGKATLISEPFPRPDIRQIREEIVKKKTPDGPRDTGRAKKISSCDYAAWDKYDVDTEISKIDLQEERKITETRRTQQRQKETKERRKVTKNLTIDKSSLTGTELDVMAEREREKGNEAFRAGDYAEALEHYNSCIKINSSLTAYNNRAMTLIKLRRYEDALNDCNVVLSTEYTNIKALLRRALTLEHLEKSSQALVDYEAVLKLEPTNKLAIAGVKKLRKPSNSKQVRMKIEETVENGNEEENLDECNRNICSVEYCRNTNVDSGICFCDRAPGPSQNLKPRPHLKSDYCLENEDSRKISNTNGLTKIIKKNRETPETSKCSTILRSNKNNYSANVSTVVKTKSIFSYAMPSKSTVVIEEILDESGDSLSKDAKNNESNENKSRQTEKMKNSKVENENNNRQSKQIGDTEGKGETNSQKIQVADKYENKTNVSDKDIPRNINSPYEFMRAWQSLKNDSDLTVHAQLLRTLNSENLHTGNKLDGTMFSTIVRCFEKHFCISEETEVLKDFLRSFSLINRFSIVSMFADSEDKRCLRNIFTFLEDQGVPDATTLRRTYSV